MICVWQAFDGYPWAVWFWICSIVWFRSLRWTENGRRMEVYLDLQTTWDSLAWTEGSLSRKDGWGKGNLPVWFRGLIEVEKRWWQNGGSLL